MGILKSLSLKVLGAIIATGFVLQILWLYSNDYQFPSFSLHPHQQNDPALHCHGALDCFPSSLNFPRFNWEETSQFCRDTHPDLAESRPLMATITAQFGNPQLHYQRALGTHMMNAKVQQNDIHLLATKIVDDLWNKPAFILEILLDEMTKPENERLQWLFWFDRDTIILDSCRSPLDFLPSSLRHANERTKPNDKDGSDQDTQQIQLLVTKDWNGLNNGVFLLRVSRWSVDLFTAILAFRHYRPDVELKFTEQSAMALLLEEPQFRDNTVWVPQWWFNAYPRAKEDFSPRNGSAKEYHARRGDFLVHFAGLGNRGEAMAPWLDVAETAMSAWALEPNERDLDSEIRVFWEDWKAPESAS
ncbi:galactosyl transferase GMA12/MNN10 family-domain-containing protein [Ilyonectria robusta]|uniref:galactosyl transferase GMA12/MNN10 family-domain-containing protein n=1 Tax=Ilyonectria robusta TaxID=1079257 RepID=UPI001E8D14B9|nr:galactosyl transferase GMA12/MNN10 family-domain-containing protein [Ilyonectria robusta]KAH8663810.1 galactosyl transferase GMA12/MNN10 family-domain-containing protein [Ilyonectria robusta]